MSELRFEEYLMPAAALGPESPLPPLAATGDLHAGPPLDPDVPADEGRYFGWGGRATCLPYRVQDGYDRARVPRAFRAAVLENDILRAIFLPELGGRLWSLVHKPSDRELLYVNPVFQPGNLAIRNAWFSGGVEWNCGLAGHTPFTCAPLFTARLRLPDGTPVLRLYEWERIRQAPYQLDAWLPDGSPVLFVRVRLVNPHDHMVPMYWWSNIAAPETPGTRVLVPATSAFHFGYTTGMTPTPVPYHDGKDVSYPAHLDQAMDFFYRIPAGRRPWIAVLDAAGRGLVQTSTARLRGRKLFVWGMGAGGRRWQEFLSVPDCPYLEIQAGLARTQMEHLPMPGKAEWTWLEAYGLMEADHAAVHGADWDAAWRTVDARLDALIDTPALDAAFARTAALPDTPPAEIVQYGSGWGALERLRRAADGEPPCSGAGLPFPDDSLGEEQAPWLALLRHGTLPSRPSAGDPGALLTQPAWRDRLEQAVRRDAHWLAWLHLGVMRCDAGDAAGARAAWERSLALEPSAWALRNLAVLHEEPATAADLYLQACRLAPACWQLAAECAQALLAADRPQAWLDLSAALPEPVRATGRIRYLIARASLAAGDLDRVGHILRDGLVVPDMREGEVALSDLWFDYHAQQLARREGLPLNDALRARVRRECPPPALYDFRMVGE